MRFIIHFGLLVVALCGYAGEKAPQVYVGTGPDGSVYTFDIAPAHAVGGDMMSSYQPLIIKRKSGKVVHTSAALSVHASNWSIEAGKDGDPKHDMVGVYEMQDHAHVLVCREQCGAKTPMKLLAAAGDA